MSQWDFFGQSNEGFLLAAAQGEPECVGCGCSPCACYYDPTQLYVDLPQAPAPLSPPPMYDTGEFDPAAFVLAGLEPGGDALGAFLSLTAAGDACASYCPPPPPLQYSPDVAPDDFIPALALYTAAQGASFAAAGAGAIAADTNYAPEPYPPRWAWQLPDY